jgi:hypothetical protein
MATFHFYETKLVVYEALITADSEEKARELYSEMDDSDKDVNNSDTVKIKVYPSAIAVPQN